MTVERRVLSFVSDKKRFNYRVAGVVIQNDHILVCRMNDDDFVLLPGGRMEFGEESAIALEREIAEELQHGGAVDRLLFTAEDHFHRHGEDFHEIGMYYAVNLAPGFPFVSNAPCLTTQDEGHDLHFSWVPVDHQILADWNLMPFWLRQRLSSLPDTHAHVVHRER